MYGYSWQEVVATLLFLACILPLIIYLNVSFAVCAYYRSKSSVNNSLKGLNRNG